MRVEKVIGRKEKASNRQFAENMREICNDKYSEFVITGELWLELADRIDGIVSDERIAEIELLKKELSELVHRNEGLERKVEMLNQVCEEGRSTTEFYRGKNEAYEFAFRCLGGKDGNS